MANISEAFGVFKVKADNKEIASNIMDAIFRLQVGLPYKMSEASEKERTFCEDCNGKWEIDTHFSGNGKWDFNHNIRAMSSWEECKLNNVDLKFLVENEWDLTYDYNDIEMGCTSFYEAVTTVHHEKGESLKNIEFIDVRFSDIDINVYSLIKYGVVDCLNDALGYFGVGYVDAINWFENAKYREYLIGCCKRGLDAYMNEMNCSKEDALENYFNDETFISIVNYVESNAMQFDETRNEIDTLE